MKSWLLAFTISASVFAVEITPTIRLNQSISFADDMNFANLDLAIERQLTSYDIQGLAGDIRFGTKVYPRKVMRDSLVLLK